MDVEFAQEIMTQVANACSAKFIRWPRVLAELERNYEKTQGYQMAMAYQQSSPFRLRQSVKNQCINICLHVAKEDGMLSDYVFAQEGQMSVRGGWSLLQVRPERAEDFVLFLVGEVFGYVVDVDRLRENDTALGLDMQQRKSHKSSGYYRGFQGRDWKNLCNNLGTGNNRFGFTPFQSGKTRQGLSWRDAFLGRIPFLCKGYSDSEPEIEPEIDSEYSESLISPEIDSEYSESMISPEIDSENSEWMTFFND
jgi:hypothetical protein